MRTTARLVMTIGVVLTMTFGVPWRASAAPDPCLDSYDTCYAVCQYMYNGPYQDPENLQECLYRCALYYHICETIRDDVPIQCPPVGGACR